jgi:RNA processing factor Prp31
VAEELAARSDAVADALDAGDVCTAAVRADELQDATVTAINNGQVPQEFQEDLQARANELVNTVNCPPPPTTTEEDEEQNGEGKGRGKKKGHEKKGGGDEEQPQDDPVVTVPPPTDVIP